MGAVYERDRGNSKKTPTTSQGKLVSPVKILLAVPTSGCLASFCPALLYHRASLISEMLNTKKPYTPT